MTRILLNPLVQDTSGLAVKHGRLSAVPTGGTFPQARAWDIYPYNPASIDLDPPAINTAWQLTLTIGATVTARFVTFSGQAVDWDHLTDVDPDSLEPVPVGPALEEWEVVRDQLVTEAQNLIVAHRNDDAPHPAYDDMPDLTLLFDNVAQSGYVVDDSASADLTTVFVDNL